MVGDGEDNELLNLLEQDPASRRALLALPADFMARVECAIWLDDLCEDEPMSQGEVERSIEEAQHIARTLEARDAARAAADEASR